MAHEWGPCGGRTITGSAEGSDASWFNSKDDSTAVAQNWISLLAAFWWTAWRKRIELYIGRQGVTYSLAQSWMCVCVCSCAYSTGTADFVFVIVPIFRLWCKNTDPTNKCWNLFWKDLHVFWKLWKHIMWFFTSQTTAQFSSKYGLFLFTSHPHSLHTVLLEWVSVLWKLYILYNYILRKYATVFLELFLPLYEHLLFTKMTLRCQISMNQASHSWWSYTEPSINL